MKTYEPDELKAINSSTSGRVMTSSSRSPKWKNNFLESKTTNCSGLRKRFFHGPSPHINISMNSYKIYFDGSITRNPGGIAAIGFSIYKSGISSPIATGHEVIGEGAGMTCNVAEFAALYAALYRFVEKWDDAPGIINVYGDSALVINMMNKAWKPNKTKEKAYIKPFLECEDIVTEMRRNNLKINFSWIPRDQNVECDNLSKAHKHIDVVDWFASLDQS